MIRDTAERALKAEAADFIASMRRTTLDSLARVQTREPYALLDYPDHSNVGDAAIWLGTLNLLTELNGRAPAYVATLKHFDARLCNRLVGNGTIYFLGGGNLGSLYSKHHRLRLAAIAALPDNPIVQLPQSFAWSENDQALLHDTRRLYGGPRRTLYCRESTSVQFAERVLGLPALMCPDLAFGIGPCDRAEGRRPVSTLLRNDLERKRRRNSASLPESDWRDSPKVMAWRRGGRLLDMALIRLDPAGAGLSLRLRRTVAQHKVAAGVAFASRGRFLITDRLHGHILSILIAMPHAVIDNTTGKNAAFLRSWTGGLSFVTLVEDVNAGLAALAAMRRVGT